MKWTFKLIGAAILSAVFCDNFDGVLYWVMYFLVYFSILILFDADKEIYK